VTASPSFRLKREVFGFSFYLFKGGLVLPQPPPIN
jgi:hypothetical protein